MTNDLSVILKKYSVPSIFFVLGIVMIILGISSGQSAMWFISSLMVLASGALSLFFSSGFLKTGFGKILGYIAGVAAVFAIYLAFKGVNDTEAHNERYKFSVIVVHENLGNIRIAQKAYKEKYGVFAPTWEKLEDFITNGTVPEIIAKGFVPAQKLTPEQSKFIYNDNRPVDNNMTELEALALSKRPDLFPEFKNFRRDTIQVKYLDKQFKTVSYLEKRKKTELGKFYVDSLKYIPFTGGREKFTLTTKDSLFIGTDKVPVIEVRGKYPIPKIHGSTMREDVYFGSLTLPDLNGSWE